MNIQRPEHLDAQYIYRDYGGCIFKLPRNKDLNYQSIEFQEYYYWELARQAYKQLIVDNSKKSSPSTTTQVANWEITTTPQQIQTVHYFQKPTSRYIELNEIKKTQRDKLIATSFTQVFTNTNLANPNNPFQYIEKMP